MKGVLLDFAVHASVGTGTVYVLVLLLGELVGAPLELTPGEWALALGAGVSPALPGYALGLLHCKQWKREKGKPRSSEAGPLPPPPPSGAGG